MTACASSDPREFPENHAVEVKASVEDDEGCPGDDGDEAEQELVQTELAHVFGRTESLSHMTKEGRDVRKSALPSSQTE